LILPGFGIVSHIVEAFSRKPVFGQDGPKGAFFTAPLLSQRTICRKGAAFKGRNTYSVSEQHAPRWVKISALEAPNPQITNARLARLLLKYTADALFKSALWAWFSTLVGISEAIRSLLFILLTTYLLSSSAALSESTFLLATGATLPAAPLTEAEGGRKFNEWLGGLIDGDGCFQLSKKGYGSLEIVTELRDQQALYQVKQKFGGAVKLRAGDNHLRYRLHNRHGLLKLIAAVSGQIRNPTRLQQLNRICLHYNAPFEFAKPLTYRNGWLSGFFDSDGSVYLNLLSDQAFITVSQKNKLLLDPLKELYGGEIYAIRAVEAFKWTVYRKEEISALVNDYFRHYPSRTAKSQRLHLLNTYVELRAQKAHLASENSTLGKVWKKFLLDWARYGRDE
jgi:hypothetical protein